MATRLGWSLPLPAPGKSSTASTSATPIPRSSHVAVRSRAAAAEDPTETSSAAVVEEDAAGLGELGDAGGGPVARPAVVGVGLAEQVAEAPLHGAAVGHAVPVDLVGEPERLDRPPDRVVERGDRPRLVTVEPGHLGHERPVQAAGPAHGEAQALHHPPSSDEGQLPRRVHGGQDVLGRGALLLEVELELLAAAVEAVAAAGEPDGGDLEAEAQPGLGDAVALLELERQAVEVVEELGVEVAVVGGDDPGHQVTAAAPRGDDGEV